MLSPGKLEKLRHAVKLHVNWFVASILGDEALTVSERAELEQFKKLPKQSLSFIEKGFILGRLKAIFKKTEWKGLSWEGFLELIDRQSLSPLEKLVLQQAKMSAAQHIKGLADDIAAGVFDQLAKTTNQVISEASLKQVIRDEVELAILEDKSYKELASSLAAKTRTAYGRRWVQISRTELHSAKSHGLAQAIINKVDIYKHSQGIDSVVSIVPKPGTCPDCADHYLDGSGNPLVFPLRQLMGAGSNADPGVVHKKTKGVHLQWKTTLPPLHPNCRCELIFIPPGYTWVNAQLTLTDQTALKKAIGDSKLSATVKPQGPASATPKGPTNPPSVPGIKSPGQGPSTGRPAGSGAVPTAWAGMDVEYIPKGAGDKPEGALGETEHSWVIPKGFKPGKALTPEQEEQKKAIEKQSAIDYGKKDKPHAEVLSHLGKGKINDVRDLTGGFSGVPTKLVQIDGNGRGILKGTTKKLFGTGSAGVMAGESTTVPGTGPQREAAAYTTCMQFGLGSHVPPTTTRSHDGAQHSIQSWSEDFDSLSDAVRKPTPTDSKTATVVATQDLKSKFKSKNRVKDLLDRCPESKREGLLKKLSEGVTMQIVQNHGDAHAGNVLVSKDFSDVRFIDNTAAFGHGMVGVSSEIHRDMHRAGMKMKVPAPLLDKFSKTSYGDIKKATKGLPTREAAQTFLRMRYVEHLMTKDDHLDFRDFIPVVGDGTGKLMPRIGMGAGSDMKEELSDFDDMEKKKALPHDKFVKFAREFITAAKTESHPDNASVNSLLEECDQDDLLSDSESYFKKHVLPNSEPGKHPAHTTTDKSEPSGVKTVQAKIKKSLYLSNPGRSWS